MNNLLLKKIALSGVLSAFALIAFMLENLMPPIFLPGARLGLSNIFILLAVFFLGDVYGVAVFLVKIILGSVFSGNISLMMYSLPSGAIALGFEILLLHFYKKFGVISVSVFGGCINLTLQNVTFAIIAKTNVMLAYLPYFALIGIISGSVIGLIVWLIDKKFPVAVKARFYSQNSIDNKEKNFD